jgi:hypothetical protein
MICSSPCQQWEDKNWLAFLGQQLLQPSGIGSSTQAAFKHDALEHHVQNFYVVQTACADDKDVVICHAAPALKQGFAKLNHLRCVAN